MRFFQQIASGVPEGARELGRYAVDLICRAMARRAGGVVTRVSLMPELRIRGSEKKLASQEAVGLRQW